MKYLSTFEAAEKWGISPRRVGILCNQNRISGAQKAGSRWIIPENAEKPSDVRIKSGKYRKETRCAYETGISPWHDPTAETIGFNEGAKNYAGRAGF